MFLFVNDFGIDITITVTRDCVPVDISGATQTDILLTKPDGTVLTKSASFVTDGTDGQIKYTVESGVLDVVGTWKARGLITEGIIKLFHTEQVPFAVKA